MDNPMKVLIIEDNANEADRLEQYFAAQPDMDVVGVTGSAPEGLDLVQRYYPDGIILDLELDEGNGMQFLLQLHKLVLPIRPYIIVTTWTSEHRTLQYVKDKGAGFVQVKSKPGYQEYGPEMLAELLREIRPYLGDSPAQDGRPAPVTEAPAQREEREMRRVREWLGRINISSGRLAQAYLAATICMSARYIREYGEVPGLEKVIYPEVEKKFGLSHGSLEKTMRYGVEHAWNHTDPETLAREYTQYVPLDKGKPLLKDFILYYAHKLI